MLNNLSIFYLLLLATSGEDVPLRKVLFPATTITGSTGGVAADAKVCSEIGLKMLESDGSAMDAAVASTLCQGIIYPFASGIGGGGFMVIKPANSDEGIAVNFRETSPSLATQDMFINPIRSSTAGGLSVAVPGEILGLYEAHKLFGKLSWKEVVQPSIDLCLNGYNVTRQLNMRLERNKELIAKFANLKKFYSNDDNSFVREGQVLRDTKLAKTLTSVRDFGPKGFYSGWVADSIVKSINEAGGKFQLKDLSEYKVKIEKALTSEVFGHKVLFTPPPSGGPVTVFILKVMESYLKANKYKEFTKEYLHQLVEAYKYAFAGRFLLSDPDFVNIDKQLQYLLSNTTPNQVVDQTRDVNATYPVQHYFDTIGVDPSGDAEDKGTSHVSVIDKDGLMVSVTSTTNTEFGSKIFDPNTGILFNNEMDDFSSPGLANAFGLAPSNFNLIQLNKRPQSSICPLILFDGDNKLAIGASGGSRIVTSVAQAVADHLGLGSSLELAIGYPRVHHQLLPESLRLEKGGFNFNTLAYLKDLNFTIVENEITESNVNVVKASNHKVVAISDPRKNGLAAAY